VQLIDAKMIRVHIREGDNWNGEPLYEAILKCATEVGIAGATVYSGILGYGAHRPHIQWRKRLAVWRDDPVTVAIVDAEETVKKLIKAIEPMVIGRSMIAMSDVTVVRYTAESDDAQAGAAEAPQP
jgi:PII-like signaling protein